MDNWLVIDQRENCDPAVNLALEEYALRNFDRNYSYLMLYINDPCIVIGKHQNVFQEVNWFEVDRRRLPILRRISGGGAVYHDPGNLNISFITNHTLQNFNNYGNFVKPIVEIINELGAPVTMNPRNNLVIGGQKLSGNAQFSSRGRMISHGSLLFSAQLDALTDCLQVNPEDQIECRASQSVRAEVVNLSDLLSTRMSLRQFSDLLIGRLAGSSYKKVTLTATEREQIEALAEQKYRDWQWNIALSPDCRIKRHRQIRESEVNIALEIIGGIIREYHLTSALFNLAERQFIRNSIVGAAFRKTEIFDRVERFQREFSGKNLSGAEWLRLFY
jgi:lipoate-protein ligase A